MKGIILALILTSISTHVMAKWEQYAYMKDDGTSIYIDRSTIRENRNIVRMWYLNDYKTMQINPRYKFQSTKGLTEFDCVDEKTRMLTFLHYTGNMGGGRVVHVNDEGPGIWEYIVPGSVYEILWLVACGKE